MRNLRNKERKRTKRRERFLNSKLSKLSVSDMRNKGFSIINILPHYTISHYVHNSTILTFYNGSIQLHRYHSGNCQSLQVMYANMIFKYNADNSINMKESRERAEFMMFSIFRFTGCPTRIFFDIREELLEPMKDILGIYFTNFRVKRYRNGNGSRMVSLIGDTDLLMWRVILEAYRSFDEDNQAMAKSSRILNVKRILELKDIDY